MITHYIYSKFARRNLHLRALSRKKVVENLNAGAFLEESCGKFDALILKAGLSFGLEPGSS
jgi:hypothetical protein